MRFENNRSDTIIGEKQSGKNEFRGLVNVLKIDKKRIRRTLYWFAAELLVLAIVLLLLVYKPKGYEAVVPDTSGRVSKYLTHELGQEFYNKAQLGEPFELVVEEAGLNDIIVTGEWVMPQTEARASLPVVRFVPGKMIVMASAWLSEMEFVATIEITANADEAGRPGLSVHSVKVGAVPVTLAAKAVAKKMYNEQISELPPEHIAVQLAASLFDGHPFEPVLDAGGKLVKISKIEVDEGKARVGFVPVKRR